MTDFKVGMRLYSAVCDSQIVIVRVPAGTVELTCGGEPMLLDGTQRGTSIEARINGGTQLGKRYVDVECGIEALCTKPGTGPLAVDGRMLTIKAAQALPASD